MFRIPIQNATYSSTTSTIISTNRFSGIYNTSYNTTISPFNDCNSTECKFCLAISDYLVYISVALSSLFYLTPMVLQTIFLRFVLI